MRSSLSMTGSSVPWLARLRRASGRSASAAVLVAVLVALPLATGSSMTEAAEVPLVVAIDTSRSLTGDDIRAVRTAVSDQLDRLPPRSRVGLVAFNDTASWLAHPSSSVSEAKAALPRLTPSGSFTVLHDALFIAARELEAPGVILLITDGRDENSATTVEDVAGLCSANQIHVVAASLGRSIDARALRRLALLTDGTYVGRLRSSDSATIASAIAEASDKARAAQSSRSPAEAARASRPAQPDAAGVGQLESSADLAGTDRTDTEGTGVIDPAAEPADQPTAGQRREAEPRSGVLDGLTMLVLGGLGVVVLIALAVWLMVRKDRSSRRDDALAMGELDQQLSDEPLPPELSEVEQAAQSQPIADMAIPDESVLDPAVFDKAPMPPGLDRTMVLDELPVLIVRQAGRPPRSYTLPRDQVFAVGRAPKVNTLQLQEPTVSAQHFKLVPKNGEYYVVDLETTNGTSVNHKKVRVKKLGPGDMIMAGTVEFEFKLSVRRMT